MHFPTTQCLATLFAINTHAFPVQERTTSTFLPPSEDPFYIPAPGFESTKPGTILNHRTISNASTVYGSPNIGAAYQLLYRTQSTLGVPIGVVTTVFIPSNNSNPAKYLSYQIPEDASYVNCAPSYTLQTNTTGAFLLNDDLALITASCTRLVRLDSRLRRPTSCIHIRSTG